MLNSYDSYNSNDGLCLEKVEDEDTCEEVERLDELLTNLEGIIKELLDIKKMVRDEWKKPTLAKYLGCDIRQLCRLWKMAAATKYKDMDAIKLMCDQREYILRRYELHKEFTCQNNAVQKCEY